MIKLNSETDTTDMKRKICFITGTRADYGIMAPLMKRLQSEPSVELQVIATNMHLSPEFGLTVNEIEKDGLPVTERVESLLSGDTPSATVKSMGLTQIGLADAFTRLKPDMAVVLGDRYEMLAAASAALIFQIPVAHLYGGEITKGAYDDALRAAITQLSTYHFTSTSLYADRVVQMGAEPENVFWVGALGVDNIKNSEVLSLPELEDSIGFKLGPKYLVATFHPVTKQPGEEEKQTLAFLHALDKAIGEGWKVLITLPNSDTGGRKVSHLIGQWAAAHPDTVKAVASLGRLRFYSALKWSGGMTGNSSSGMIEAPAFGIPTLNVGDRQEGRARGRSVVDTGASQHEIEAGLMKILSPGFRALIPEFENPYEKEGTLENIAARLLTLPLR